MADSVWFIRINKGFIFQYKQALLKAVIFYLLFVKEA